MLNSPLQHICITYQHQNWHRKILSNEQLQNDIDDYKKDYRGFMHQHSPLCSIVAELRTFIYVPDMLVTKIIIQIQSFAQRHFLQGTRSKALYSTNSIQQCEKIARSKATKIRCTTAGTCAKLVNQLAKTFILFFCTNYG